MATEPPLSRPFFWWLFKLLKRNGRDVNRRSHTSDCNARYDVRIKLVETWLLVCLTWRGNVGRLFVMVLHIVLTQSRVWNTRFWLAEGWSSDYDYCCANFWKLAVMSIHVSWLILQYQMTRIIHFVFPKIAFLVMPFSNWLWYHFKNWNGACC